MRTYSWFYQNLSGYYIVITMNYIVALTLTRKTILFQVLSDCDVKTRPFKRMFFPIIHSFIYYNKKAKKRFLWCKI